ncbi:DUF2062 domain-containing protein [Oceanicoccus sp. KOV_DT_Chl]|uniref:DUF2062 domain-containing protein n=1 Tax=Oceanicoccus sp. KOV_DT_Chl TaxID=1904639 RepID=UPI000C7AD684|nr:DUF2062 domain-containing protein [Oceanicoccus sp. KOV_DT_Chl]
MARKFIKRYMPDPEWIKQQKSLQLLGNWIHDPNIWHLTRHSVSMACFIGLFVAFIPLPTQMLIAALAAVLMRANLAIATILVWVSNPVTMPALFYLAYKVGAAVMDRPEQQFVFELSWQWLTTEIGYTWQPFLLGCLLCGLFSGLAGSAFVRYAWRQHTIRRWHERRLKRQKKS